MAIAFDASATGSNDGASSFSFNHTCTGSDRMLFVAIHNGEGDTLSSVTYNSVAMTQVGKHAAGGTSEYVYLYKLVGPATGTHSVTLTRSGSGPRFRAASSSYTGCNGTIDVSGTNGATSNPCGVTISVTASNCWIVTGGGGTDPVSASTGVNSRGNPGGILIGDSNTTVSTGNNTLEVTTTGTVNLGIVAAAMQPGTQFIAYTITCTAGSYAITGNTLTFHRVITAILTSGVYAITGNALAFKRNYQMAMTSGVYTITGNAITLFWRTWKYVTKHATSWTTGTKHSTVWTNRPKGN